MPLVDKNDICVKIDQSDLDEDFMVQYNAWVMEGKQLQSKLYAQLVGSKRYRAAKAQVSRTTSPVVRKDLGHIGIDPRGEALPLQFVFQSSIRAKSFVDPKLLSQLINGNLLTEKEKRYLLRETLPENCSMWISGETKKQQETPKKF